MANWNKPDGSSTKTNFPGEVRSIATNAAKQSYSGDTNLPTGAIQYNRSTKVWEEWNGSAFVELPAPLDSFATITNTPSAGSWSVISHEGAVRNFYGDMWALSLTVAGTLSSASAAYFDITTTSPTIDAAFGALGAIVFPCLTWEGNASIDSGTLVQNYCYIKSGTTNTIRVRKVGSNFNTGIVGVFIQGVVF